MNKIYDDDSLSFKKHLSRGDFFVLVERRALGWAIKKGRGTAAPVQLGSNYSVFNYGRPAATQAIDVDAQEGPFADGLANWKSDNPDDPTTALGSVNVGLKGLVTEYDLVALLGIHNVGLLGYDNSGFKGRWGRCRDRDRLNNDFYTFLMGANRRRFNLVQTSSSLHSGPQNRPEKNYASPPPTHNKLQWTGGPVGATKTAGRIMLNVDMGMYHVFTAGANGEVNKKYCPQLRNTTLFDCSTKDASYMPLSSNVDQMLTYKNNKDTYYVDVIKAFVKMTSVPSTEDPKTYQNFVPEYVCEGGVPVCKGDVFLLECSDFDNPCRP